MSRQGYSRSQLGDLTLTEVAARLGHVPTLCSATGTVTSLSYQTPVALDGYKVNVGLYQGRISNGYQAPDWGVHPLDGQVFATHDEAQAAKWDADVVTAYLTPDEATRVRLMTLKGV